MSATCQHPTSEVDDEATPIFGTIALVSCGKPAAWTVDTGADEYGACEEHTIDALLYEDARRAWANDGDDVRVNEDGQLEASR